MSDHIEIPTTETERKIIAILCKSSKPHLLKDIAAEIGKTADDTKAYMLQISRMHRIAYGHADDGSPTVQLVTGPHHARFRKPE